MVESITAIFLNIFEIYFPTLFKGKCQDYPKEQYDSLTNTCVDVNECDRWLKPDGAEKDFYTLYEEAVRTGGDGAAEWKKIVDDDVTVYDLNNLLFETTSGGAAGKFIIASGKPNANLCANVGAQPSIGTATFAKGTGADFNLQEWFEFFESITV